MKKLNSETKNIFLFIVVGILMVLTLTYSVFKEQEFIKSAFSKKVQDIVVFRDIDCFYFTDGTSKCFYEYSVIVKNDTLIGVRITSCGGIGDSIVKRKNEALIRVVRK